jgi:glycosyltransferase involved in cell wall biosynthesis
MDNIPNTFLESMALGIPVICIESGFANEMIIQGVNGLMVSEREPEALSEAIESLWAGTIHFEKQKVKETLSESFNPEQQIDKLLNVVYSLRK